MSMITRSLIGGLILGQLAIVSLSATDDLGLANAVKNQDKDAARLALKRHVDVNAPLGDGSTALHWAAHWNDLEMADLLVAAGANANAETDLGVTPVYLASEIGSAAMTEKLLAAGANPNRAASTGVSPLMLAARAGSVGAVQALLAHGADMNAKERSREQTALMWAVAQGHPDVVRVLGERSVDVHARSLSSPMLVNKGGPEGGSNAEEVQRAAQGLRAWTQTGGNTALLFAARNGDIECARLLLGFGANVNDVGADHNSALVVAAHSGNGAFAAFLLDSGANPNADGAGYTVLHAAVLRGDLDLVKAALLHDANPNAQTTSGTPVKRQSADFFLPAALVGATPLLLAAKYASTDIISVLLDAGADLRLTAKDGTTPLMAAANADHRRQAAFIYARPEDLRDVADETQGREAVRMLLDAGADINATSQAGNTALHVAASGRSNTIIELLAQQGAKLDLKNQLGQTPLALASGRRRGADASQPNLTVDLLRKLGAKE
jgi:ankyrin repeat protein